jgi:hypothetical protein
LNVVVCEATAAAGNAAAAASPVTIVNIRTTLLMRRSFLCVEVVCLATN